MRRLGILAGSGAFAIFLLVGLEFLLRATGIGALPEHYSSLRYQRLQLPLLEQKTDVFQPADPRLAWDTLSNPKEPGCLRILVYGGSAVAGLGLSPNAAFPRYLERMLKAAYPGREFEVANLGIVALASKQVQRLVRDGCERYDPDVVIVYSGNNEFLEAHAREYARSKGSFPGFLRSLHLVRALSAAVSKKRAIELPRWNEGDASLRVSQVEMVQNLSFPPERIEAAFDDYEGNLERMVSATQAAGARLVLCTVASNWQWLGREEPPSTWLATFVGPGEAAPSSEADRLIQARARLDAELAPGSGTTPSKIYELLHHRARLRASQGDLDGAREDYRASMNRDPHLRRALDAQNDRVTRVAAKRGVLLFDAVAYLSQASQDGIVGFDLLFDYVHFTPTGAITIAEGLVQVLAQAGIVPGDTATATAFAEVERSELEQRSNDWLSLDHFLGFAFDPAHLVDRDLWKYDQLLIRLSDRIEAQPTPPALLYRGNIYAMRPDGRPAAESDYRRALEIAEDAATQAIARSNLAALASARGTPND